MSLCRQRAPRDANPSGKLMKTVGPGVQLFSRQTYLGYQYQIARRRLGLTVERVQYSASIEHASGQPLTYLEKFASMKAARAAAEQWINAEEARVERAERQAVQQAAAVKRRHDLAAWYR